MAIGRDNTIHKKVVAKVKSKIAEKQKVYNEEVVKIDEEFAEVEAGLRAQLAEVPGDKARAKDLVASKLVDDIIA